jgi:hypothetical protein
MLREASIEHRGCAELIPYPDIFANLQRIATVYRGSGQHGVRPGDWPWGEDRSLWSRLAAVLCSLIPAPGAGVAGHQDLRLGPDGTGCDSCLAGKTLPDGRGSARVLDWLHRKESQVRNLRLFRDNPQVAEHGVEIDFRRVAVQHRTGRDRQAGTQRLVLKKA